MIKAKNPTLLNVSYVRPNKRLEQKECFQVIYIDDNGEVQYTDEPADVDIFIVKPEYRTYSYNKPEERIEHMDKVRVRYSKIRYKIAEEAGEWGKNIIEQSYQQNDYRLLNQLYKWPYAYVCDFQPEYYYMKQWYDKYPLKTPKLTKAFLDIETDMIDYKIDLDDIPNTAYSPVNLVTVVLDETKDVYTFVLRPYVPPRNGRSDKEYKKRYDLYEKQLKDHQKMMNNMNQFIDSLHDEFDKTYGHLNYHIREYEKEIDLIADIFRLINTRKPNFCMEWNMRFDIQYIYYRIIALGYDPVSIMCHPDFKHQKCYFKVDTSTYKIEKQYDFFYCSSYTQFICQMRLYASIRKSQHKLKSVSLNAIGDRELRDRKVDYPEETNIIMFPYVDWLRFIKYNIKDVLIQFGIERKTKDILTYYMRSHSNMTPYNKIFKETHLLRNVREMYFEKDGWAQSNNINIISDRVLSDTERQFYGLIEDDDSDEGGASYKGAINAIPTMNDYVGQRVMGSKTNNIFINAMDYDMGAFYPSIKIASNMDPITLLYKASFDNNEFLSGQYPNRSLNTTYEEKDKNNKMRKLDITGEAVNTYTTNNTLTFAFNYLGIPDMPSLLDMVRQQINS